MLEVARLHLHGSVADTFFPHLLEEIAGYVLSIDGPHSGNYVLLIFETKPPVTERNADHNARHLSERKRVVCMRSSRCIIRSLDWAYNRSALTALPLADL
eukprot:gnl/TRDRNA2_/TRDRNA2_203105_c0_seq1.p2 gnl/TRDRNA2_/TRDRNA2_203105_c0~~gnl/TRDRNA2_/TRDRNA2_203105_c0_seq1.p2  ORF type:complete len:100 (-),score=13.19 gnl/TRDRNA2_/TRDRNA2_203105_c0_seq1:56-355(-)